MISVRTKTKFRHDFRFQISDFRLIEMNLIENDIIIDVGFVFISRFSFRD